MLQAQTRRGNVKQLFNSAALLLLGLLRYRIVRPSFALGGPGDPVGAPDREMLEKVIQQAETIAAGSQKKLIEDIRAFLAGKGSNQLIFRELDDS